MKPECTLKCTLTGKSPFEEFEHFGRNVFRTVRLQMGVNVQRGPGILMSGEILRRGHVHAIQDKGRDEGMTQNMRRDLKVDAADTIRIVLGGLAENRRDNVLHQLAIVQAAFILPFLGRTLLDEVPKVSPLRSGQGTAGAVADHEG